jgi:HlyD family secretion protein
MTTSTPQSLVTSRTLRIAGIFLAVFAVGTLVFAFIRAGGEEVYPGATSEVLRGNLIISVTESGNLSNRDQVIVANRVEGRTTVIWIVEEGQMVSKDDLLVELDSSGLEDRLVDREIAIQNAEALYIRAQQELNVTKSRTQSEIAEAELALRFAKLDLEKYTGDQGEYAQELDRLQADIDIAQEELLRAEQKYQDSKDLAEAEFITSLELEGDRLSFQRAQVNLRLARGQLSLSRDYTHNRNLEQKESDVERAGERLDRTRMSAHADIVQAEANYKAREQEFSRQKEQLEHLRNQISLCRIVAPADGMVVYETSANPGRRGNREPLEAGQEVRERQELIYLPASEGMMAEVSIHESALERVEVGMLVRVRVDARPGQVFQGQVRRIAPMPDAQSIWLNPDLTVYSTSISVEASNLRTGMSCQVEILVDELSDVLYVPVQSVVRMGNQHRVYIPGARGGLQAREVEIGYDNNRVVHIRSGLEAGERVALAPPLPDTYDKQKRSDSNGGTETAEARVPERPAAEEAPPESEPLERTQRERPGGERRGDGTGERSGGGRPRPAPEN